MARFKNPEDQRYYEGVRKAFRAAGLSRAQLDQAIDWYNELRPGQSPQELRQSFAEYAERVGWNAGHAIAAIRSYESVARNGGDYGSAPSSSFDDRTIARAEGMLKDTPDLYWADQSLQEDYAAALDRRQGKGGADALPDYAGHWDRSGQPNVTADNSAERQAIEGLMRSNPAAYWGSKAVQDRFREILSEHVAPGDPMNPSAGPVDLGAAERPSDGSTLNGL